jgi:hypothetical protein
MERVTATIDSQTLARIKRVAGKRGVSAFIAAAAKARLARLELLGYLDELDKKFGAVPEKVRRKVDRDMRRIFGKR